MFDVHATGCLPISSFASFTQVSAVYSSNPFPIFLSPAAIATPTAIPPRGSFNICGEFLAAVYLDVRDETFNRGRWK